MICSFFRRRREPKSGNGILSDALPRVLLLKKVLLMFVCAFLLSCVPKPRAVLSLEEVPPYEGSVTVDVLKRHIVLQDVTTLKAKLRVRAGEGSRKLGSYKGAILYARPHSVRLRLYGAFGSAGLDAAHSDDFLKIYFPREKVLYKGRSPSAQGELTYVIRDDGEEYVLLAFAPGDGSRQLQASYIFDRRTLLNKEVNYYNDGERLLRMRFSRYSNGVPELADIDLANGFSIRAELIEPEKGAEVPEQLFDIAVGHEGVMVFPLVELIDGINN